MPDFLGQATIGANGMAEVDISHNKASIIWIVEQITCTVGPASTIGVVGVFKNGNPIGPSGILSPLSNPLGASSLCQTFAGLPYVPLQGSDTIQVVASSATAGDQMNIRAQYREYPVGDSHVAGVLGGF